MRYLLSFAIISMFIACASTSSPSRDAEASRAVDTEAPTESKESALTVVVASDVVWEQLNPARGDASPKAATLWGDRNGPEQTGFLVKFVDGFASPPHIHNVSYRGVVISGLVHNDKPDAEEVWMPPGSYWTQPRGGPHITAAKGVETVAFIEIDEGPYLVQPLEEAYDSGETAVNIDASSIQWLAGSSDVGEGLQVAPLWGEHDGENPRGQLVKLPAGSSATMSSDGGSLHLVIVAGTAAIDGETEDGLSPGSYAHARSGASLPLSCQGAEECLVYVRADGRVDLTPQH